MDYLARYPLTTELLAEVRSIVFDGGGEIYRYAWYFWGGDDDMFDIVDLGGIERCPNVTSLEAISMIERLDIRQLLLLARLEYLSISTELENLDALQDLVGLRRLRLLGDATYTEAMTPGHPTRKLLDGLKARGVVVWLSPMTWPGQARPRAFE